MSRILLIDDSPLWGLVMLRAASKLESVASIDHVTDPFAGTHQALADEVDAVIVDAEMPGRHGIDVIRALRQGGFVGVVLLCTTTAGQGIRAQAMEAGADAVREKPDRLKDVQALLHDLATGKIVA